MESREPGCGGDDVGGLLVGEVVRVGHQPDVVEPGLVEQRDRVGERRHEGGRLPLPGVDRLEREPDAGRPGRLGGAAEAVEDERAGLRLRAVAERPAQAEHAVRLVRGETRDRRADRLEPLGRVRRPLEAGDREGEEGRHGRDAVRDREAVLGEQGAVRRVVGRQLHLPQADRVEPGGRVRPYLVLERRVDGGDRREGQLHERPGIFASKRRPSAGFVSSFATR